MMNIEKYVSSGKGVVAAGLTAIALTGCSSMIKTPIKAAEEVIKMSYTIITLPIKSLPWLKDEPPINACIKNPKERVCKLYLKNYKDDTTEEYFGVYYKGDNISGDEKQKLVLGYWNEDDVDMDGKKYLTVVIYDGKSSNDFIIPDYGNLNFSYVEFKEYFNKPGVNTLNTTDNPLENLREKNMINAFQLKIFLGKLHKRIGYALKLIDAKKKIKDNK